MEILQLALPPMKVSCKVFYTSTVNFQNRNLLSYTQSSQQQYIQCYEWAHMFIWQAQAGFTQCNCFVYYLVAMLFCMS